MSADESTADVEVAPRGQGSPSGTDRGTIMLVALVVLAVIASIIMLFSHSDAAMKVAVLAALWAAFLGLFLVARFRKAADDERAKAETQRIQFESDLRREQQEFEKKQLTAAASKDTELLEEIKGQLAELREQLEELSGRQFGYEPAALLAEAHRIQEIEAVAADVEKQQSQPATSETEAVVSEHAPLIDDTVVITPTEEPVQGKDRFNTGSFSAVTLDPPVQDKEEGVDKPASHGRRRRDEHSDSVSVAELLANLKKNK